LPEYRKDERILTGGERVREIRIGRRIAGANTEVRVVEHGTRLRLVQPSNHFCVD
jgi:hypothetical protein